jgi:hypothetical protein
MTREELEAFRSAYDKSVRKCKKGKDKKGKKIEEQTEWIWFDRNTLMDLLKHADEKTGGIKMYIGQYDKKNIKILPDSFPDKENYIGRISLALTPANKTDAGIIDVTSSSVEVLRASSEESNLIRNAGSICPPFCSPPPPPPSE